MVKIIQHIIKVKIPFEVFEEATHLLTRNEKSLAHRILNKVQPKVKFEKSKFLRFMYNYLVSTRSKMWTTGDMDSDGILAVTLTITAFIRDTCGMSQSSW